LLACVAYVALDGNPALYSLQTWRIVLKDGLYDDDDDDDDERMNFNVA